MGYHVSILRTQGKQSVAIALAEARTALEQAAWQFNETDSSFVRRDADGTESVLWFGEGELWAKTPSARTLEHMIAVAGHLNARVRGDELETYKSIDEWYIHSDDAEAREKVGANVRRVRSQDTRRWLLRFGLLAVVLVSLAFNWLRRQ